ncbi:VanZ like family protein [Halalkaliarchaeum sp. AArc-CO]|uniref:VanZ family protein n=1 Tax=Halalkaliarchaeum sp. AArc-CO TaxID=2866381 RepID=UPI00217E572C|nr:VanZ family protein [Halalkaliarchaeum sp. AArc-CO]UWG50579.1 VanZ like family protein [Halalkaliarchaeum sp. AArc-CO]
MRSRRFRLPLFPRWVRLALVGAVMGTILYFSIIPMPGGDAFRTGPFGILPFSKWMHLLAYGGLALVLAYALHDSPRPDWQILSIVFLIAVGYGIGIELVQATVPERTYSPLDMVTNAVGAAVAVGLWRAVVQYVRFYRIRKLAELKPPVQ